MVNEAKFWQDMPEVQQQLNKIDPIIQDNLSSVKGKLGDALRYAFSASGKKLRPAFVLEFGQLQKPAKNDRLLKIAASVEVLHNATLIHDDIIDESPNRHGRESIQAKYGKQIAVYAGDFLFALSLRLLSNNTSKITNLRLNGTAMQNILAGETEQFGNEYNLQITKKEYLEQIKGKTAILFGYSCFIGALEGGLKKSVANQAKKIGEAVGMAFQLKDDILDYTSESSVLNKPVLADVVNGVYTGPLIFALEKDQDHQLHDLVKKGKKLTTADLRKIDRLVKNNGGIRDAEALATDYTNNALNLLEEHFQQYPNSKIIKQMINKLLKRQY
ncbi:polyprenyl synthetase family protein [uncultured Lactobacillus sp.]|uniref:polyprenyl synthetase family protein n=1 Tax=uncultured Lactobacillus sp. TaxID=153152 RepID=UPI00280584B8|nr:polyprenyl synthetase family protein [uncultured Lactobacillus sp.]